MEIRDFFISYNKENKNYAKQIANILETNNYTVHIQAWDIRPSDDFMEKMNEFLENSRGFIAIVSGKYFESEYCKKEWWAAFNKYVTNKNYRFFSFRVEDVKMPELTKTIVWIDLMNIPEINFKKKILQTVDENPIPRPSLNILKTNLDFNKGENLERGIKELFKSSDSKIVSDIIAITSLMPLLIETIYKNLTNRKKALLTAMHKMVKKSLSKSIPNINKFLIDDMDNGIRYCYESDKKYSFENTEECIYRSLIELEQLNLNPKEITTFFLCNLLHELVNYRDVNDLIDSQIFVNIFIKKISISNSTDITVLKRYISEFNLKMVNELEIRKNALFIPNSFVSYFERPLFLENMFKDKAAHLSETYIIPKYKIQDIPYVNEKKEYNDIIKLIIDFWNNDLRHNNYGTKYSFKTSNINTLFIKGHAGSGKTSLFYFLANTKSIDTTFLPSVKMYFVRLIELLKYKKNLLTDVYPLNDIIEMLGIEEKNIKGSLIILDGLDEICTIKNFSINDYCINLIDSLTNVKCKIIITTRLNYINLPHSPYNNVLNTEMLSFEKDDIIQWVNKYVNIHVNHEFKNKNQILDNYEKYSDIFAVPLLLYMIISLDISLENIENVAELYDKVFEELYLRTYNKNEDVQIQRHGVTRLITPEHSREIAKEIAYNMYIKNTLLLSIEDELIASIEKVISDTEKYKNDFFDVYAKKRIEKLFPITFFYKEIRNDIVEFAHKSIMEFFAGERLADIFMHSIDIKGAILTYFVEQYITPEVFMYFNYHIKAKYDEECYLKLLYSNLKAYLQEGHLFRNVQTTQVNYDATKVLFKSYWLMLSNFCINYLVEEVYTWDYVRISLINLFKNNNYENITFLDNRALPISFNSANIENYDFAHCSLEKVKFVKSKINNSNFTNCIINECEFEDVNFVSCQLSPNNSISFSMHNCKIFNSTISDLKGYLLWDNITIKGGIFKNIILTNAILCDVEFIDVDSYGISFENSKITNTMIDGDILKNITIKNTEINNFEIRVNEVNGLDIINCNLINLRFVKTIFRNMSLITLDFSKVIFDTCRFENTNIINTNIESASFVTYDDKKTL